MMVLALGLSFSGFTALSLAMERHQQALKGAKAAPPARRRPWSLLGWVLLAAAFAACVAGHGWGLGAVLWLGALTLAGLLLAFGLYPWRPAWIAPLAWVLPVLGVAAMFL